MQPSPASLKSGSPLGPGFLSGGDGIHCVALSKTLRLVTTVRVQTIEGMIMLELVNC